MSKARNIADLKFQNSVDIGTESTKVAAGTNAERPSSPEVGDIRYNSDIGKNEAYDADGWTAIAPPPSISAVSPTSINESDTTQTIVITGQKFDANATGLMVDSNGASITPTTSTRNSSSQITITYSGGDVVSNTNEPYDVKVTNGTGLSAVLEDAVSLNETPDWSTTSGTLATVVEDEAMSSVQLSATDPEGSSVTYSVASGSLPSGITLSSSGLISGTPNVNDTYNSSGVQHNFSVDASDGANTTNRTFNIIRKWRDGSSSSLAATSAQQIYNDTGIQTNGVYYIDFGGNGGVQQIYCLMASGFGSAKWMVVANHRGTVMPRASSSGHQPRLTANSSQVGTSGANSHQPNINFSINVDGFAMNQVIHFAHSGTWGSNFANIYAHYEMQFNNLTLTNSSTTYNHATTGGGNRVTGFGDRLYNTNQYDYNAYRPYGMLLGQSAGGAGATAQDYPIWHGYWIQSNQTGTFSFSDESATASSTNSPTGWDDMQDGSGMGDSWAVENQGANAYRGYASAICIR